MEEAYWVQLVALCAIGSARLWLASILFWFDGGIL